MNTPPPEFPVEYEVRDGIAVITLNRPPVNALGQAVRKGVADAIECAADDDAVTAVVLIGEGRCFCGGADIREFGETPVPPSLPDVIAVIEASPKPVVAALHGVAFGGGFELPLGCHYRVGAPSARMALPEVTLGLIPGAGGTQRLPRLIGAEKALAMILSGKPVQADKAHALGILDAVLDEDALLDGAIAFAQARAEKGGPFQSARDSRPETPEDGFFEAERKKIERRARGLIAPWYCIESVENVFRLPFDEGLARERELFMECRGSEQSAAQRHIFFAEREARKVPGVHRETPVQTIEKAAIIGCGTMGTGIAMVFADAGIPVTIVDSDAGMLEKGLGRIKSTCVGSVKRGRMSEAAMNTCLSLVEGATDMSGAGVSDADIVIEAVFEDMDLKKEIFSNLDAICKPGAVLASNTSTLDVDEIAAATKRPDSVIGTHFFSPANIMRLMENVRGAKTSPETIATVMTLAARIGKVGVLVGNCDGFVGNRMYHHYTRQAAFLLEEGALPQQVDKAIYDFGFAMGPFAVGDVSGLDVSWRIRQRRAKTRPSDERYSPIADRLCEMDRFGQKTGAGWYRYEDGSRTPIPDPAVEEVILKVSEDLGFSRREISEEEMIERCLYTLVNEGAKILDEGMALRPSDIDVIWVYGYGFPKHRGGPMFYADQVGLGVVHEALCRLAETHGDLFQPSPLLEKLVREGKGFKDL
ncbi:MAG: enoyl-CoA hydratase/isomerase family protein [Rhodospirillales bacterium]|nr:enoyl-CoA hydratase/isomerase family protein [Rhodospirillales bacterium]